MPGTMSPQDAEHVVGILARIAAPFTQADYEGVAGLENWITAGEVPGESIVAEGPWKTGGRITTGFTDGNVESLAIAIATSTDRSATAVAHADGTYVRMVGIVTTILGTPDGDAKGDRPRTWWADAHRAIHVSRRLTAVILAWTSPELHVKLVSELSEQA